MFRHNQLRSTSEGGLTLLMADHLLLVNRGGWIECDGVGAQDG